MEITIRPVIETDLESVVELMHDFADYEDLSAYCTVTSERLQAAMFEPGRFVDGLIALDGEKSVAYALFYPSFSSFRGELGLYLEDIYVLADYRRNDLGIRLLRAIAAHAAANGLERIDFQVLDWNEPAVNFYLKHGAEKNDDESHFKFAADAFRRLAML
jgi:ribosomal protein S18 acetylase RimI-like enzyme